MFVKIQTSINNGFILEQANGSLGYRSEKMTINAKDYDKFCALQMSVMDEENTALTPIEEKVYSFFRIEDDYPLVCAPADGQLGEFLELRHVLVNKTHYITPYRIYITADNGSTYQAI